MKGRPVDIDDLTRRLNEVRMSSNSKTFTRGELSEVLESLGFNKCITGYALASLFTHEKIGTSKLYSFNKEPIHKTQIEGLYKKYRKSKNDYVHKHSSKKGISIVSDSPNERAMIEYLKSKGYQIRKPVGFDVQKFSEMNPELFKKFMKYETL